MQKKYSQSKYRDAIAYLTVFHSTFPSRTLHVSQIMLGTVLTLLILTSFQSNPYNFKQSDSQGHVNPIRIKLCFNFLSVVRLPISAFHLSCLSKTKPNYIWTILTFSAKLASKIPAKFPQNQPFFHKFVPENPAKFDFFSTIYQKP